MTIADLNERGSLLGNLIRKYTGYEIWLYDLGASPSVAFKCMNCAKRLKAEIMYMMEENMPGSTRHERKYFYMIP